MCKACFTPVWFTLCITKSVFSGSGLWPSKVFLSKAQKNWKMNNQLTLTFRLNIICLQIWCDLTVCNFMVTLKALFSYGGTIFRGLFYHGSFDLLILWSYNDRHKSTTLNEIWSSFFYNMDLSCHTVGDGLFWY